MIITVFLVACQTISIPFSVSSLKPTATSAVILPSPTSLATSTVPFPDPTALLATPGMTPTPSYQVHFHPDAGLFVGDRVSFEVISPPGFDRPGREVNIQVEQPIRESLGSARFGKFGLGGRDQATLIWAWNTTGLASGAYTLTFSVSPDGPTWSQPVTLQPDSALPAPEPSAQWATAQSNCCLVYYVTKTAAERDLPNLLKLADAQANDVSQKFHANFKESLPIDFVPRVLGQGGFTQNDVSVSYLDRNYAGGSTDIVLHHEMVHLLDGQLGGEFRPTMLVEGLAVYLSGGHFKPEPLLPRAAALLSLGWYIPLDQLVDGFYPSQHEIGYLEAAALIQYMVQTYGWDGFSQFYRDIHQPEKGASQMDALDKALLTHFGLAHQELERRFKQVLQAQTVDDNQRTDLRLTVMFYDAMRRYQQDFDPSAYYLTAWMMDNAQMRQKGIVADVLRHPAAPENQALETMLTAAFERLRLGDYPACEQFVESANAVLAAYEQGNSNLFSVDPLAGDSLAIAQALDDRGYQLQRLELDKNTARAWVSMTGPDLTEFTLTKQADRWEPLKMTQPTP